MYAYENACRYIEHILLYFKTLCLLLKIDHNKFYNKINFSFSTKVINFQSTRNKGCYNSNKTTSPTLSLRVFFYK